MGVLSLPRALRLGNQDRTDDGPGDSGREGQLPGLWFITPETGLRARGRERVKDGESGGLEGAVDTGEGRGCAKEGAQPALGGDCAT